MSAGVVAAGSILPIIPCGFPFSFSWRWFQAADKKTCTILTANTHTLALLLKGLFEHGIEYPQDISYHDLCSPALGVTCLNCAISSEVAQKYQCTKIFPIGLE